MNKSEREMENGINEIVGTFADPIIVMPGGWGETLPPWLKEAITLERLMANMEGLRSGTMTATDAETCAYLYTASLEAPMDHDWSQIYLYIAGKTYARHNGSQVPDDIQVESLNNYQMTELNRLKSWIYRKRAQVRQEGRE